MLGHEPSFSDLVQLSKFTKEKMKTTAEKQIILHTIYMFVLLKELHLHHFPLSVGTLMVSLHKSGGNFLPVPLMGSPILAFIVIVESKV